MNRVIFLGTDAQNRLGEGVPELTGRGELQVQAVAQDLLYQWSLAGTVAPPVILGTSFGEHRLTAAALQARLDPTARFIDWSQGGDDSFLNPEDATSLARMLRVFAPGSHAVVLVTTWRNAERILQAAGQPVNISLRNMRATRLYPVRLLLDDIFGRAHGIMPEHHAADLVGAPPWPEDRPWD